MSSHENGFEGENPPEEEYQPEYAWGKCRACGNMGNCSTDDGYCGDCN